MAPSRYLFEWKVDLPPSVFDDKAALWDGHGFDGGPIGYLVLDEAGLAELLVRLDVDRPAPDDWPLEVTQGLLYARVEPISTSLWRVTVVDGFVRLATREVLLAHIHASAGRFGGATPSEESDLLAAGREAGCDFTWEPQPLDAME